MDMRMKTIWTCAAAGFWLLAANSASAQFLQTDPVGYKDDLNMYAYVGDDPTDRVDPKGTYACSASMTRARCDNFKREQDEAKGRIRADLKALKALSAELHSNAPLSKEALATADKFSKMVSDREVAQNPEYVDKLIQVGQQDLSALNGGIPAVNFPPNGRTDYADSADPRVLKLFPAFWSSSPMMQQETLAHEGSHLGARTVDGGIYGRRAVENKVDSIADPAGALNYADVAAHALGFTRDDRP